MTAGAPPADRLAGRSAWAIVEQLVSAASAYALLFLGARRWDEAGFAGYAVAITVGWLVSAVVSSWSSQAAAITLVPGAVAGSPELAALRRIQVPILAIAAAAALASSAIVPFAPASTAAGSAGLWLAAAAAACARVGFDTEKRIEIACGSSRYVAFSVAVNALPAVLLAALPLPPERVLQAAAAVGVAGAWAMRAGSPVATGPFSGWGRLSAHGGWLLAAAALDWFAVQGHLVYAAHLLEPRQVAAAAAVRSVCGLIQVPLIGIEQMVVPHLRALGDAAARRRLLDRLRLGLLAAVVLGTAGAWLAGDWLMARAFPRLEPGQGPLLAYQMACQACAVLAWVETWRIKGEARIGALPMPYVAAAAVAVPLLLLSAAPLGSAAVATATAAALLVYTVVLRVRA